MGVLPDREPMPLRLGENGSHGEVFFWLQANEVATAESLRELIPADVFSVMRQTHWNPGNPTDSLYYWNREDAMRHYREAVKAVNALDVDYN